MKYIKRPIPVEAFLWRGEVTVDGMPFGTIHDVYELIPDGQVGGFIDTLEARTLEIRSGEHYIVGPGYDGEYWPVRKDIFEATYVEAPEAA